MCIVTHVDSRTIIKALEADGWEHKRTTGSHWHFKHPTKPGLVTVPHPKRDLPTGTVKAIERQAGLQLLR
jgi:predicted RNA binding protein YcfA (HicA-like mRNA interferase family)